MNKLEIATHLAAAMIVNNYRIGLSDQMVEEQERTQILELIIYEAVDTADKLIDHAELTDSYFEVPDSNNKKEHIVSHEAVVFTKAEN